MANQNDQGDIWEVFVQSKSGLPYKHVGSVHAYDKGMAIENARDLYTRRQEGTSIWVVPTAAIVASQPDDSDAFFDNQADRDFYLSKIYDSEHCNVTIVRPKEDAKKALEPYIGYIENWSQMYSGNTLRAKNKDDQRLVELTQRVAQDYIKTYNEEYHLSS